MVHTASIRFERTNENLTYRNHLKQKQHILIANSDRGESANLADMIRSLGCRIHTCHSIGDMMQVLADSSFMAVILDIDSLDIDNRSIQIADIRLSFSDFTTLDNEFKVNGFINSHFHGSTEECFVPGTFPTYIVTSTVKSSEEQNIS